MGIEKNYITALNSLFGIRYNAFLNLKNKFGSIENVFSAPYEDLVEVNGISQGLGGKVLSLNVEDFFQKEEKLLKKGGVSVITIEDEEYPKQLKSIFDPPLVLYIKGELKKEDINAIAIVGSRKPTNYGQIVTQSFSSSLGKMEITIVSGMARGIDSFAHESVLSAGGRTIAVLGCGVDIIYPPENRKLKEKIASSGAVISEFSMGTKPDRMNFPRRNRIISGLSIGTLVIEAAIKSGALITADFALEHGREVFAVPGNINSINSKGCNHLIKNGAKLVTNIEDIIEEIPYNVQKEIKARKKIVKKNIEFSTSENYILSFISSEEQHIDDLIRKSNYQPSKLLNILTGLELLGAIKQLKGKMFVREG